jgi:hypothetical protein
MSLGNVPRKNMSAEDNRIKVRLLVYDALVKRYMQLDLPKTEASRRALSEVLGMTRKRALTTLENLTKLEKGIP